MSSEAVERIKAASDKVRLEIRRLDEMEDFVDTLNVCFHSINADGKILWANRYELRTLGYSEEEFFGRDLREFLVDPDQLEYVRQLRNGHAHPVEVYVKTGGGAHKKMQLTPAGRLEELPYVPESSSREAVALY